MLNWVVIGIGDITRRRVIPAIEAEPRSRLYGVVTRDPAKAAAYPQAKVFRSLDEAMRDTDVQAVYIGTPPFLHREQTLQALWSSRDVLCEKPLAMNLEEAQEMVEAAAEAKRLLGVAYYRRHYPKVQRARELMQGGVIGRPVLVEASYHGALPQDGFRDWLTDPEQAGGGPLFDVGSHRIDLLNYLFGTPVGVCAHLSNVVADLAVEDSATCVIEYKTGVRGVLDVRWGISPVRDELRITGTLGEINLSPLNSPKITYPGGEEELPPHVNLHYPMIAGFVDAVLEGKPLLSSGASAVWTDWVTEQALATSPGEEAE